MLRPWKNEVSNALEVSVQLVNFIEEIYGEAIVETEEGTEIHADKAIKSQQYESYLENASHLEQVNLQELDQEELLCFFFNVYQCMYIHKFLKELNSGDGKVDDSGIVSSITNYIFKSNGKKFFYNIGGLIYTLEEMKHGVLRGN